MHAAGWFTSIALVGSLSLACASVEEPAKPDGSTAESAAPGLAPLLPPLPETTAPTIDSPPIANPEGIVAMVQLPSGFASDVVTWMANMAQGTKATMPEGPVVLQGAVGMDLGGARLDRPVSVLVVDPTRNPLPFAVLVEVGDRAKLSAAVERSGRIMREHDGRALIGSSAVVEQVAAVAFGLSRTPDHSELVLYPEAAFPMLRPMLERSMAEDLGRLGAPTQPATTGMLDVLASLAAQIDRVVVSVGASKASSDIFVRIYPKPGSTLARFTAAQRPSDHAQLAKLPHLESPVSVFSGTLQAGEAHDAVRDGIIALTKQSNSLALTDEQWQAIFDGWLTTFDGNCAFMARSWPTGKPGSGTQLVMGSTDPQAMRQAWHELARAMANNGGYEQFGVKIATSFTPDALFHDDVAIDRFGATVDTSSLPFLARVTTGASPQWGMDFAVVEELGLMTFIDRSDAGYEAIEAAIDVARGTGTMLQPTPGLRAVIEEAKANGDSWTFYLDVRALAPEPQAGRRAPFSALAMGLGRHADALSVRASYRL